MIKNASLLFISTLVAISVAGQDAPAASFCGSLTTLLKDYTASSLNNSKDKQTGTLTYSSKIHLDGFTEEEISSGDFYAIYSQVSATSDEAATILTQVSEQARACTGFKPFYTKVGGDKMAMFTNNNTNRTVFSLMVNKKSRREYVVKLHLFGGM